MAGIAHSLCRVWNLSLAAGAAALLAASPAVAQTEQPIYSIDLSKPSPAGPPDDTGSQQKAGSVATSSVGTVGQRQEQSQDIANITPTARLDTRVANRVQSRMRNRIDRFYNPQANTTSPFKVAAEQAADTNQADR